MSKKYSYGQHNISFRGQNKPIEISKLYIVRGIPPESNDKEELNPDNFVISTDSDSGEQQWTKKQENGVTTYSTSTINASIKIRFTGSRFWIYGTKRPNHGYIQISCNGVDHIVNQKGEEQIDALLYGSELLEYQNYEVIITNKGSDFQGSSGKQIMADSNFAEITGFHFTAFADKTHLKFNEQVFENLTNKDNPDVGNAFAINDTIETVTFNKCIFKNCGTKGFVITVRATKIFEFINCTIEFSSNEAACRGIAIFSKCDVTIDGCLFDKCAGAEHSTGACIYYNTSESTGSDNIIIRNVIFRNISGTNIRCFNIETDNSLEIFNMTIQECNGTGYNGIFTIHNQSIDIEYSQFINNSANHKYGGGCGIVFEIKHDKPEITFKNCTWDSNYAFKSESSGGYGGAIQIGYSESNNSYILNFEDCVFTGNKADVSGAALSLSTTGKDTSIQNCQFTLNTANLNSSSQGTGGGIHIESKPSSEVNCIFNVMNCFFEGNSAYDGHALSLTGNNHVDFRINTNNIFTNNGANQGSSICVNGHDLEIQNAVFNFTSDLTRNGKSRAIELSVNAKITLENITFENCVTLTQNGGAILFSTSSSYQNSLLDDSEDQGYTISNCQFINCMARQGKGAAICIDSNVNKVEIKDTTFIGGESSNGSAIYIGQGSKEVIIEQNVQFLNQAMKDNFAIVSDCDNLQISNILFRSEEEQGSGCIKITGGNATITSIFFDHIAVGIFVDENAGAVTIENCIFSDCNSGSGSVNTIQNQNCEFTSNIINFTSNTKAKRGLDILSTGNIIAQHNHFINCSGLNQLGTVYIKDQKIKGDNTVDFTYNVIEGSGPNKMNIFVIDTNHKLNFAHNIFKNCVSNDYSCSLELRENNRNYTFYNQTFENCESAGLYGGGIGFWITCANGNTGVDGSFTFEDCKFLNNKVLTCKSNEISGYGGAVYLGRSEKNSKLEMIFSYCIFSGNKADKNGGALALRQRGSTIIQHCIFNNNYAGMSEKDQKYEGGAIFIEPNGPFSNSFDYCVISNCTIGSNNAKGNNGTAMYCKGFTNPRILINQNTVFIDNGKNQERVGYAFCIESENFEIVDSQIKYSSLSYSSSGIVIRTASSDNSNLKITNVSFYQVYGMNEKANAISIEKTAKVSIENCTFDTCGGSGAKYTIYDEGKHTTIEGCQFNTSDFINHDVFTSSIKIVSIGYHSITNCYINDSWSDSGSIYYKPEIETGTEEEFICQNIIVEHIRGGDQAAFHAEISNPDAVTIDHITIRNCTEGVVLVGIYLLNEADQFTFNSFNFTNNIVQKSYSGGAGIWLKVENTSYFNFENCCFIGNTFNSHIGGGAIQIGTAFENVDIYVNITNCIFERNQASHNGGAVSLSTQYSAYIDGCTFKDNHAGNKGGAIYINPDHNPVANHRMESLTIVRTTFDSNTAGVGGDDDSQNPGGTAIYIQGGVYTRVEITDNCVFKQTKTNRHKAHIISDCSLFEVHHINFDFDSSVSWSGRPILISNGNANIYNVNFTRCKPGSGPGTAIKTESSSNATTIENCVFEDCGTDYSVYHESKYVIFNNNLITYTSTGGLGIKIINSVDISITNCNVTRSNGVGALHINTKNINQNIMISNIEFTGNTGTNKRCFDISAIKIFTFEDIRIHDLPLGSYIGGIDFGGFVNNYEEFTFENCKWINNKCTSSSGAIYGGGSGLWLTNGGVDMTFKFNNCLFEGNWHDKKGGALHDGESVNTRNKHISFYKCTFKQNSALKGGALAIETFLPFEIDSCSFISNHANETGGSIYINASTAAYEDAVIKNCKFDSNTVGDSNGSPVICIQNSQKTHIIIEGSNVFTNKGEKGSIIASSCGNLEIKNQVFDFNSTNAQRDFRALELANESGTTITNCQFIGTGFTNEKEGNAILAQRANLVQISSCIFTDCGKIVNLLSYVVTSSAKTFNFEQSTINFTNTDVSCGGLQILRWCTLYINASSFTKCYMKNNASGQSSQGACIQYADKPGMKDEERGQLYECKVRVQGTLFQNCHCNNGRGYCGRLGNIAQWSNCTFRDMKSTGGSGYIFSSGHSFNRDQQAILDRIIFLDNDSPCTDGGGGCGIWYVLVQTLTFHECQFIRNRLTSNSHGGAIGFGVKSGNPRNVSIVLDSCLFEDNEVKDDYYGSSLYIEIDRSISIKSCKFISSKVDKAKFGGAIYIKAATAVGVTNTTFSSVNSRQNGNAIYIEESQTSVTISENTQFINCGISNSVIYSKAKSLSITKSIITFTESSYGKSCRGIQVASISEFVLRDTLLENCWLKDGNGCGLNLFESRNDQTTNNGESVEIEQVTFSNCEGNNGRAIFALCGILPSISYVTIKGSVNTQGSYIFMLEFTTQVQEIVLDHCVFENLSSNVASGGGSGIFITKSDSIVFNNCSFVNVRSGMNGGALAYGTDQKILNNELTFILCYFADNRAGNNYNGSALFIDIAKPLNLTQCNFTGHSITGYGGSLYLTNRIPNVHIHNTEFHHSNETGGNGNAIFLELGLTNVLLSLCKFVKCGSKGSVISSYAAELIIKDGTFTFEEEASSRAILIQVSTDIQIIDTLFFGCGDKNSPGGGIQYSGKVAANQPENIHIEGCTFNNNKGSNGCAIYMFLNEMPIIRNNIFKNHRFNKWTLSVFFNKKIYDEFVLEDCTFQNNEYSDKTSSNDGGGCAIWVATANSVVGYLEHKLPLTFRFCKFIENHAGLYGGAMAYGDSPTLKHIQLTYSGCSFTDNYADGKEGGALWIITQEICIIDNCTFTGNFIKNQECSGNAIAFKGKTLPMIVDTLFLDNGESGSAIIFEGNEFTMQNSNIDFTFVNSSCRGIEFRSKAIIEIESSSFERCATDGRGGGIHFLKSIESTNTLSFTLFDCIFNNNSASNGCALLLEMDVVPEITSCIFKNHLSGKYVFYIVFTQYQMVFELNNCTFEMNSYNNSEANPDSGGSGIWISNSETISQGRLIQMQFNDVTFRNNIAPYVGGAFAFGKSAAVVGSELIFDHCTFDGNTAEGGAGGALWIATRSPYEVNYCQFKNNMVTGANARGGSIMIDTPAPIVTISYSSFKQETAAKDGNSIYSTEQSARVILSGNNFTDCGTENSVVTIESLIAGIDSNVFEFTTTDESCRGLNIMQAGTYEIKGNKFVHCSANNGGGLIYTNQKEGTTSEVISIIENTFEGCNANEGCAMYLKVKAYPSIENNNFVKNRNGTRVVSVYFLQKYSDIIIDGWTFEKNYASNDANQEDGGGSGIWIENMITSYNMTFRNCKWIDNVAPYAGGALSYGRSSKLTNIGLIFESCLFENNKCKAEIGGALWINNNNKVTFNNCNFTNNKALGTRSYGGAIYFNEESTAVVEFENTLFTKNSGIDSNALHLTSNLSSVYINNCNIINNGNLGSTITSSCSEISIYNTFIGFDAYSLSNRGLYITRKAKVTILHCRFENCKAPAEHAKGEGGGILYSIGEQNNNVENITIEDSIFSKCNGTNGCALMLRTTTAVVFNNNTISHCRSGNFILSIITQEYVDEFYFEECTFYRNMFDRKQRPSEDGGGCGIWAENDKEKIPQGSFNTLTFKSCIWSENSATGFGGALAYGDSPTLVKTAITFDDCLIHDNFARGKEGGGLWLAVNESIMIKDCTFKNNRAIGTSSIGGSLVIRSTSSHINVLRCNFNSNSAKEGNGIYVKSPTNDLNITECSFDNCGTYGSVLNIESRNILLDTCYIQFSNKNKACRGIIFTSKCDAYIKDTHLVNCKTTGQGGGLLVQESAKEGSLILEGCLFNSCESNNGCAILANLNTPIQLRNNLVWHHSKGNFIVSVFYHSYVNETVVEDCYFEHNFFSSGADCGGSGIWIAHAKTIKVPDTDLNKLTFVGCTWNNNTAETYGGAFAYGTSPTIKVMDLEFTECNFINNSAKKDCGGALYIVTNKTFVLRDCFFDNNQAARQGGAIHYDKMIGNIVIEDCKFARNFADEAGAIYAAGGVSNSWSNNIFSENEATVKAPSLLIINNGAENFSISYCKFDFNRVIGQTQIQIQGMSNNSIVFTDCCFTHSGDAIETSSTHMNVIQVGGEIKLETGNCFNIRKDLAISVANTTELFVASESIFNCTSCQVPDITPLPTTNIPTASPAPTPEMTPLPTGDLPDPTPKPTLTSDEPKTPTPTLSQIATITPTIDENSTDIDSESSSKDDSTESGDNNNSRKIGLIAGIVIAVLVIIAVVVIILWLFIFHGRGNNDYNYNDNSYTTKSQEMNYEGDTFEPSTEITNDDGIWDDGAKYMSQENPLYTSPDVNDNDYDDDELMMSGGDFEESF